MVVVLMVVVVVMVVLMVVVVVLPFWYRLTQVVMEKRPLNGWSSSVGGGGGSGSSSSSSSSSYTCVDPGRQEHPAPVPREQLPEHDARAPVLLHAADETGRRLEPDPVQPVRLRASRLRHQLH